MVILRFYYLLIVGCLILIGSCTTQYDKVLKSTDYALKYQKANEYYAAKKYQKATALYEQSKTYYHGAPQDDTLRFYLAKSYFKYGDVYSAEYYFNEFYTMFPRSPFVEEAFFLYIVSLYNQTHRYELDQSPSHKTLAAISEFTYLYPKSEYIKECSEIKEDMMQRLDEKQYESAKLYYITEDYKAAATALRASMKDYPDSRYREDILYLMVASAYKYAESSYIHLQKDRYQAVIDEYYNFVSEFPESKYRKNVEKMYANAYSFLKKGQPAADTKITNN